MDFYLLKCTEIKKERSKKKKYKSNANQRYLDRHHEKRE